MKWLGSVSTYTIAGGISSGLLGGLLGSAGAFLLRGSIGRYAPTFAIAVAIIATIREMGWIVISVPEPKRQTRDLWAKQFPRPIPEALWGLDIGLTIASRFTFSGVWVLGVLAFVAQDVMYGAETFLFYWLGRAASVWIAPRLLGSASDTPSLLDGIQAEYKFFKSIHIYALIWLTILQTVGMVSKF